MEMITIEKMFKTKDMSTMTTRNKWITITVTDRALICLEAEASFIPLEKYDEKNSIKKAYGEKRLLQL